MNKTSFIMTKLEELVHLCSKKNKNLFGINNLVVILGITILCSCSTKDSFNDLSAFDVKNPEGVTGILYEDAGADWVKYINYEGQIVKFKDGKCTNWNELIEGELSIEYGKDSLTICSLSDLSASTLTFSFDNGKIASACYESKFDAEDLTFNYSHEDETVLANINVEEIDINVTFGEVNKHSIITSAEITKTDDHGNWIERKFCNANGEESVESRIIYYEGNEDNGDEDTEATNDDGMDLDFTSNDLAFFELHGHVKNFKMKYKEHERTFNFNEDGTIISVDNIALGEDVPYEEWDFPRINKENDLICSISTIDGLNEFSWRDGRPFKEEAYGEGPFHTISTFEFDNQGRKIKENVENEFEEETENFTISYTYTEEDDHGNWTKRVKTWNSGDSYQETRTITYYK